METAPTPGQSIEPVRAAEVVLPCAELQPTLDFFVDRLGFRLERISPADDPREAVVSGHGLRVAFRRGLDQPPGRLRLSTSAPLAAAGELVAPNGTRIELVAAERELVLPRLRPELVVSRAGDAAGWITGRAGMRYRDLIPGRLGGRFIASHIRIPGAGPVPDHVHYHAIRFQLIYCVKGEVRVVYEDQGPPFVLAAGDAVLQPPRIRHRVLESSGDLEVIEVGCPAEHDTFLDHELELPTSAERPERTFGGQRFVHHRAADAPWRACELPGFEARDTGIATATACLASVRVLRPARAEPSVAAWRHDGELLFGYVLAGELTLEGAGPQPLRLTAGDCVTIPPGRECSFARWEDDLELLEVALPARGQVPVATDHRQR